MLDKNKVVNILNNDNSLEVIANITGIDSVDDFIIECIQQGYGYDVRRLENAEEVRELVDELRKRGFGFIKAIGNYVILDVEKEVLEEK